MKADILLVEDNEMSRDMLSRRLERSGYLVATAADGVDALDKAASTQPGLILMDLRLPELDGWECARRLRQAQETKDIHIIALTAHALREDRRLALAAGCNEYLTKPVDFKRLLQAVGRVLGPRKQDS